MSGPSRSVTSGLSREFGIVISLLIPGFIALWPFQYFSDTISIWFRGAGVAQGHLTQEPTGAGFLLISVAALATGMLIGAIRWCIMDWMYNKWSTRPRLDYSRLGDHLAAYEAIMEAHYRYYQHYSNTAVAVVIWFIGQAAAKRIPMEGVFVVWLVALVLVQAVLVGAGKDALKKMDDKLVGLLGVVPEEEGGA